jgi:hypothetical protein
VAADSTVVRLGYEVGTGKPIYIPIKHTVITGQTQEAGKTTALEALITRSGLKALTFITKRGEGSFTGARRHEPYFREQAGWEFVASLLEASRGEKMRFERAWIIRASEGARTLREVHRNVKRLMESSRGISADVYLTLNAYLDVVVPTIGSRTWASQLDLRAGVNAVDLSSVPDEMQHLVIGASIDWVLKHEEHTVIVIPEAWKFLPQGRKTPVKQSAVAYIRQGAGLKNFLWLDSQDIGGIEKEILRSAPVWILGVQREANEIKRTLENIPDGVSKPSRAKLATLELGQFFACWKTHAVRTYVQPVWLSEEAAAHVALKELPAPPPPKGASHGRDTEATRAAAHATGNERKEAPPGAAVARPLRDGRDEGAGPARDQGRSARRDAPEDDEMSPDQEKKLDIAITTLGEVAGLLRRNLEDPRVPMTFHPGTRVDPGPLPEIPARTADQVPLPEMPTDFDAERLYEAFKARLIAEAPVVLRVLVEQPAIEVDLVRHVVQVDGETLRGRIGRLIVDQYFSAARTSADISAELTKRGWAANNINLGKEIAQLVEWEIFTRDNKWIRLNPAAVGRVRVTEREA